MTLLCPECKRDLVVRDGATAVCPVHGTYRVLYQRVPVSAAVRAPVRTEPLPGEVCLQHPEVAATRLCAECGQPMCETCTFVLPGDRSVCPRCVSRPRPALSGPTPVSAGVMCATHPSVQAVHYCAACQAPICATCDFSYGGDLHLCPKCATNPRPMVSAARRAKAIISLGLAALASLALIGFLLASASSATSGDQAGAVGLFYLTLILSVAGVAVALTTRERRAANSPLSWVGIIWNAVLLGAMLLLMVVGSFSGGN